MEQTTFNLIPKAPYNFGLTAAYITYFRGRYGTDVFEDGALRQAIDFDKRLYFAMISSVGEIDSPQLEIKLSGLDLEENVVTQVRKSSAGCWV